MALCVKCRKRLAKRTCGALGAAICQRCCGALRMREIHCPGSCPHLSAHGAYQEKRLIEKTSADAGAELPGRKDVRRDERLGWLSLHIEAALAESAASRRDFADKDALLAVEYAREKTGKGSGRLIIPGEALRPVNEAGESVLKAVEACRFQGTAVLAPGLETYKKDEKLAGLELVASGIRRALRKSPDGRAYLGDLLRRFSRPGSPSSGKKLITLT